MDILLQYIPTVIAVVVSFVLGMGAISLIRDKAKSILVEVVDVLDTISGAIEDNKVTKDELLEVYKELQELVASIKK